jgi:microcystin degradation protein MlrC
MKIFAAGIATETNTFAPLPTGLEDFAILRGRDVRCGSVEHKGLDLTEPWGRMADARGDEFVFSLMAFAEPAGLTVQSAYESLRDELLSDLRNAYCAEAGKVVDIVLLMLHGAMLAQGYDSCELDIVRRVRQVVGPRAVIGVELDLHCHLSAELLELADLIVTYKEYPHVDGAERARELFNLSVRMAEGKIRPTMALFDCRMVGFYPTTREPLRGIVDAMLATEREPGVLSISFAHGFPFADVPHVGAKVLAVTDGDDELAAALAERFGRQIYRVRDRIGFDSISVPMDVALTRAYAAKQTPIVVADQSDNPGGGAAGDATFALRWLLEHGRGDAALAVLYDPEVVRMARIAGSGARLTVRLGGKLGPASGNPLDLTVTVGAVRDHYSILLPQDGAEPVPYLLGDVVLLRFGTIDIVLSNRRCQCFSPTVFSDLGVDPKAKRVLIPKSIQHFHTAFAPIAAEVIYMAAPGATAPDPRLIPYARFDPRQMYPWNPDPLG